MGCFCGGRVGGGACQQGTEFGTWFDHTGPGVVACHDEYIWNSFQNIKMAPKGCGKVVEALSQLALIMCNCPWKPGLYLEWEYCFSLQNERTIRSTSSVSVFDLLQMVGNAARHCAIAVSRNMDTSVFRVFMDGGGYPILQTLITEHYYKFPEPGSLLLALNG